jgi:hypothetical protein
MSCIWSGQSKAFDLEAYLWTAPFKRALSTFTDSAADQQGRRSIYFSSKLQVSLFYTPSVHQTRLGLRTRREKAA